jgi:hypothetical protein
MVSVSLAAVFVADGTTSPKNNSPYFSPTLFNPDCRVYSQFFGFRFWLDVNGKLDDSLFNVAPWNSPSGFLELNWPALQDRFHKHLYLSTNYNDTLVDYIENKMFSDELNKYNISHVFQIFPGSHYDVLEGVYGCFTTFAPSICPKPSSHPPQDTKSSNKVHSNANTDSGETFPLFTSVIFVGVACSLVAFVIVQAKSY